MQLWQWWFGRKPMRTASAGTSESKLEPQLARYKPSFRGNLLQCDSAHRDSMASHCGGIYCNIVKHFTAWGKQLWYNVQNNQ